jgi:Beta-glucosidase/6-phospho-beta-glucosidase/beta-galactosidase
VDPLVFGRYPIEMSSMITDNRLPSFNSSMSKLIKGSFDFLGLNYYYSNYAQWTGIPGNN